MLKKLPGAFAPCVAYDNKVLKWMLCNGAEIDKSLHFIASVIENDKQALESPWEVPKCSKHQYVGAMTNGGWFCSYQCTPVHFHTSMINAFEHFVWIRINKMTSSNQQLVKVK